MAENLLGILVKFDLNRQRVGAWVTFVIFVGSKGPWFIAGQMLQAYVYRAIEMFILLMLCPSVIHGTSYVKDAIHNQQ